MARPERIVSKLSGNTGSRPASPGFDATDQVVSRQPLPMSFEELCERGWDGVDIVFVTGDAYVDHPSFAMAILGRALEMCR